MQLGGEAFLTGTELDGAFVLRACIINPRTTVADVRALAALLARTGVAVARARDDAPP